jgi:hypothetical protein
MVKLIIMLRQKIDLTGAFPAGVRRIAQSHMFEKGGGDCFIRHATHS